MPTLFTYRLTLSLAFLLSGSWLAIAQTTCDQSIVIPEAEKKYATGNFNEVISSLTVCVENGFNEDGRVQAYKVLVKTYLAIDSLDNARNTVR
jgi:hypothetical protein